MLPEVGKFAIFTQLMAVSAIPVTHMFVPSDPEQLGQVQYANNRDNVTITVNPITLPATFYVALSYAAQGAVANALTSDLVIQAPSAVMMPPIWHL